MNRFVIRLIASVCCSFTAGYFVSYANHHQPITAKKVTGIGGIFFKSKDPKQLKIWYEKNLGLVMGEYGAQFEWRLTDDKEHKGFTLWAPFNEKTKYFQPSEKDFMLNYRVADIITLVKALKESGVTITDTIESVSYGKFVHIMDPEGNKIELWEPIDEEYEKMGDGKTTH